MTHSIISAALLSALLCACAMTPDTGAAPANVREDLRRALALARLTAVDPAIESVAVLTPADPRDGSAALIAAAPTLWNPLDGATGSIAIKGSPTGSPYDGGHAGLSFNAKAGITYLAHCRLELPGGSWDYDYGGVASGHGKVQPGSAELSMPSNKIPANGRAELAFASRQTGHKLFGCTLYGLRI
jgi:hypothetical protein